MNTLTLLLKKFCLYKILRICHWLDKIFINQKMIDCEIYHLNELRKFWLLMINLQHFKRFNRSHFVDKFIKLPGLRNFFPK